MSSQSFTRCLASLAACLPLAAGLAGSVAVAQPAGQGQPAAQAASPPASGQPATSAPPASSTQGAVTPAPDAAATAPAPDAATAPAPDAATAPAPDAATAPAPTNPSPAKVPIAAPSPPKLSPQLRAVLSQVEKRITDLHEKLHITAAEQPLWEGFADTMRQNARDMDAAAEQRRRGADGMTALADMQSYADLAQMHAAQMSKLVSTFGKLYGAMPDEQKKQADTAFKAFQSQASAGRRPG